MKRFLFRGQHRVSRPTQTTTNDIDGGCRINPRTQCPKYVSGIGRVDILIDNQDESAQIVHSGVCSCEESHLFSVSGITLLERNDQDAMYRSLLYHPNALYPGYVPIQFIPQTSRFLKVPTQ